MSFEWLQLLLYMFILNTFDSTFEWFIIKFIQNYIAIVQLGLYKWPVNPKNASLGRCAAPFV